MKLDVVQHTQHGVVIGFSIIDIPFDDWDKIKNRDTKDDRVLVRVNVGTGFTEQTAREFVAHVADVLTAAEKSKAEVFANTFLRTRHPKK